MPRLWPIAAYDRAAAAARNAAAARCADASARGGAVFGPLAVPRLCWWCSCCPIWSCGGCRCHICCWLAAGAPAAAPSGTVRGGCCCHCCALYSMLLLVLLPRTTSRRVAADPAVVRRLDFLWSMLDAFLAFFERPAPPPASKSS